MSPQTTGNHGKLFANGTINKYKLSVDSGELPPSRRPVAVGGPAGSLGLFVIPLGGGECDFPKLVRARRLALNVA